MSLKSNLKRALKQVAIRTGLEGVAASRAGSFWPSAGGRGVIFTLHHVRPDCPLPFRPNALLSVTPEFLDVAITASVQCGLTPVPLEELPRLLADRNDTRRFVSFTLDDGYRNNAEHAAPVFRKHGIPYTIFITKGFVERTRSLWWETAEALARAKDAIEFDFGHGVETVQMATTVQKREAIECIENFVRSFEEDEAIARLDMTAKAHGIDPLAITDELVMDAKELLTLSRDPLVRFGAHTLTHVNLRRVDATRLRDEITGSADAVEAYVERRPTSLAYPYGYATAVGDREFVAAADAGFTIAVTTQPDVLRTSDIARPTAFNRVSLNGLYQKKRYVEALISGIPLKFT